MLLCQVSSEVIQLQIYMHFFFLKFFSHLGYILYFLYFILFILKLVHIDIYIHIFKMIISNEFQLYALRKLIWVKVNLIHLIGSITLRWWWSVLLSTKQINKYLRKLSFAEFQSYLLNLLI